LSADAFFTGVVISGQGDRICRIHDDKDRCAGYFTTRTEQGALSTIFDETLPNRNLRAP